MVRVARNPQDSEALLDAGNAALRMGDASAAEDFLRRAERLAPANGRVKAARGAAAARRGDAAQALALFAEAERLGVPTRSFAADRALAYDLIGQFGRADAEYRLARGAADSEALVVSHAISQALAGRKAEADTLLDPLLRRNNPGAWRARAFILAARGEEKEADRIARGFLSAQAVDSLRPYFARMTKLTDAQRAAALHFGRFPPIDAIGRDSEAIRVAAATLPSAALPASQRLIPAGTALGSRKEKESAPARKLREEARAAERDRRERDAIARSARRTARGSDKEMQPAATVRLAEARPIPAPASAPASMPSGTTTLSGRVAAAPLAPASTPPVQAAGSGTATATTLRALPTPESVRPAVSAPGQPAATGTTPLATRELPATGPAVGGSAPGSTGAAAVPALPEARLATTTAQSVPPMASSVPASAPQPVNPQPAFASLDAAAGSRGPVQGPALDGSVVTTANAAPATAAPATAAPANLSTPAPVTSAAVAAVPDAAIAPAPLRSFADIVAELPIPATETRLTIVPVDLASLPKRSAPAAATGAPARIAAATKEKPAADAARTKGKGKGKEAPPAAKYPARIWVQVATGSNVKALAFDWRNLKKKAPDVYGKREAWTSPWGSRRRMVVGPFATLKEAKSFEAAQRKAGGDGFVWESEDGLVVEKLG